jgi:hypothetical protein
MTLFKRVFSNHTASKVVAPDPSSQLAGSEFETQLDDEIVSGIASAFGAQSTTSTLVLDDPIDTSNCAIEGSSTVEEPEMDIVSRQDDARNLTDPPPMALEPNPLVCQSEEDRAAQAQREIEETRQKQDQILRNVTNSASEPIASTLPQDGVDQSGETSQPIAQVRPGRAARRVRTRMLGFDQGIDTAADPFEEKPAKVTTQTQMFPVGWLVVVAGPGKGHSFAIFNGVSTIGRGTDQTVALDFGDSSVSREKHAAIAYDDEDNKFYLGHGGKSNIVRLNDRPVRSTEDLSDGDTVRIGETTLRFAALCGAAFAWGECRNDEG